MISSTITYVNTIRNRMPHVIQHNIVLIGLLNRLVEKNKRRERAHEFRWNLAELIDRQSDIRSTAVDPVFQWNASWITIRNFTSLAHDLLFGCLMFTIVVKRGNSKHSNGIDMDLGCDKRANSTTILLRTKQYLRFFIYLHFAFRRMDDFRRRLIDTVGMDGWTCWQMSISTCCYIQTPAIDEIDARSYWIGVCKYRNHFKSFAH